MAAVELGHLSGDDFIEKLARAIAGNMQISQLTGNAQSAVASQQNCPRCGYRVHKNRNDCPAMGQTCHFCEKRDHFAGVCFKKQGRNALPAARQNDRCTLNMDAEVVVKDSATKEWNVRGKLIRIGTFGQYGILKADGSFSWEHPWFVRDVNDRSRHCEDELQLGSEVDVKDRDTKLWDRGVLTRIDAATNRCRIQWPDATFTWENRKFVRMADGDDTKPQDSQSSTDYATVNEQ